MTLHDPEEPSIPSIEIVRGSATDEELAALVAVVSEAFAQEEADAVVPETPVSAWLRTRRPMRTTLRRDIPWGRYSG